MADEASVLLELAKAKFDPISPIVAGLITSVAIGNEAVSVPPNNEVEAAIISWLCTHPNAVSHVHRRGLLLNGYRISGHFLDLIHSNVPFPLHFNKCAFTGPIYLKNSRLKSLIFRGCELQRLNADSTVIEGDVAFSEGCKTSGEVSFCEAHVGSFRSDGSTFSNPDGQALVCDRIRVSSAVFLSQAAAKSTYIGEVRFSSAEVGANFDCEGASFRNEQGVALNCERLTTFGSAFIRGCNSEGIVDVSASRIAITLDCRGSVFTSLSDRTLNAEKAKVGAYALLDGNFSCDNVRLLGAEIGGGVRCYLSTIGRLDLRRAQIDGLFEWSEMKKPSLSEIDLRDATISTIKDDIKSWPKAGALKLKGMRFDGFSDSTEDVKERLKWLKLDTSGPPQAYQQLSLVYGQHGRPDLARDVLFSLEVLRRSHRRGCIAKAWNAWNALLCLTTGYGYKLWRAALLMAMLTAFGIVIAVVGYRAKLVAPTDKDASTAFIQKGTVPSNYPRFSSTIFSIEHSLPGMNLGVSANWSADTDAKWPAHKWVEHLVRSWFWIQTILGWLLSIFFVAGLSGIIKSQK